MDDLPLLSLASICIGIILDALLGDPKWLPHPIRFFGRVIAHCEQSLNTGHQKKLKGTVAGFGLVMGTGLVFLCLEALLRPFPLILCFFNGLFLFYGICSRSLVHEAVKVEKRLVRHDLAGARHQLSHIVGRQTEELTPSQVRAAILETLSENLSDGVVAPLLYYALAGVPGIMMYKMINTLDSMIGYKNDHYADFGWFSAKLDDIANLIPARLTALLMIVFPPNCEGFRVAVRYGKQHTSPNAGYPEAALAGLLNCRLGGPSIYHGTTVVKPFIGYHKRELHHGDVVAACCIVIKVSAMGYLLLMAVQFL